VVAYLALSVPVLCVGALADHLGMRTSVLWFSVAAAVGCLVMLVVVHTVDAVTQLRDTLVPDHWVPAPPGCPAPVARHTLPEAAQPAGSLRGGR
jgi:hypothetical protein